uniref:Uncharacterized protein n=1 Tax=Anopheles dirus TaxID=7168 RepID=A0A182N0R6_9DIPT
MTRTLAKYLISVVWDSEKRTLETVKITTLQYDGRIILCRRMFAALFYEVITAMLRPDPMGVARRLAAAWRNPVEFFTTLQLAASPSREPEVIDITGDAGSDDDVMEIIELSPPRPMPLSRMIRSSRAVARRTMTLRPRKVVNIP